MRVEEVEPTEEELEAERSRKLAELDELIRKEEEEKRKFEEEIAKKKAEEEGGAIII